MAGLPFHHARDTCFAFPRGRLGQQCPPLLATQHQKWPVSASDSAGLHRQSAAIYPLTLYKYFPADFGHSAFVVVDEGDEQLHGGAADFPGILVDAGVGVAIEHAEGGEADVLGHAAIDFVQEVSQFTDIGDDGIGAVGFEPVAEELAVLFAGFLFQSERGETGIRAPFHLAKEEAGTETGVHLGGSHKADTAITILPDIFKGEDAIGQLIAADEMGMRIGK